MLKRIGYWQSVQHQELPDPTQFIDHGSTYELQEFLGDYLRRGFVARSFLGQSKCRVCGQLVGSLELSDGTFVWPEGLSHYVLEHGVRLPIEFARHAVSFTDRLESQEVDDRWWISISGDSAGSQP